MTAPRAWPAPLWMPLWMLLWGLLPAAAQAATQGLEAQGLDAQGLDAASRRDLDCLRQAYGDHLRLEAQGNDLWIVVNGARVLYHTDDPTRSARGGDMGRATVRESMAQPYPLEPARPQPGPEDRPGRLRSYALLEALYAGQGTRRQGEGRYAVSVNAYPPLAAATQRVMHGLTALMREQPRLAVYMLPMGGHANRRIAGTERLSPHSYGIAIDLNPKKGGYWRWSGGTHHPAQADYPSEIVTLFENEGFIWGGKWREYDLMHFEYRPELVCKARTPARSGI